MPEGDTLPTVRRHYSERPTPRGHARAMTQEKSWAHTGVAATPCAVCDEIAVNGTWTVRLVDYRWRWLGKDRVLYWHEVVHSLCVDKEQWPEPRIVVMDEILGA